MSLLMLTATQSVERAAAIIQRAFSCVRCRAVLRTINSTEAYGLVRSRAVGESDISPMNASGWDSRTITGVVISSDLNDLKFAFAE